MPGEQMALGILASVSVTRHGPLVRADADPGIQVGDDDHNFNATWNWWQNSESVHSFPHVELNSDLLPLQLAHLLSVELCASWTMNPTHDLYSTHHPGPWSPQNYQNDIEANVALDMFLDPIPQRANVSRLPMYELMIWFNAVPGVAPIGWAESEADGHSYTLDDTTL